MSDEPVCPSPPSPPAQTAGALLRKAREAQGLHIAALAASLKVTPRKLEALERDRYEDLPDPAFTRALAQTVCRALKIDAGPVMALLPRIDAAKLDQALAGLNTPFRERPSQDEPELADLLGNPVAWVVTVLLVAALAVYFWPQSGVSEPTEAPSAPVSVPDSTVPVPPQDASALPPATEPVPATSTPEVASVTAAPALEAPAPAPAASLPPAMPATSLVSIRARAGSWISVTDADGRSLLSRTVLPDETVALDGRLPLQLIVGNAGATEVVFRGEPVDLQPHVTGNVARLQLR